MDDSLFAPTRAQTMRLRRRAEHDIYDLVRAIRLKVAFGTLVALMGLLFGLSLWLPETRQYLIRLNEPWATHRPPANLHIAGLFFIAWGVIYGTAVVFKWIRFERRVAEEGWGRQVTFERVDGPSGTDDASR